MWAPDPNVPRHGKSRTISPNPYSSWVFMGYYPQESLENTINTMGTRTLGVHPNCPLIHGGDGKGIPPKIAIDIP